MNHRSLAFRLGAWYTLLLIAVFGLLGTATFFGLQSYLHASIVDSLRRRSIQVEQILFEAVPGISAAELAAQIETRVSPEFNNRFIRVTLLPATVVYRSGPPADASFDPSAVGTPDAAKASPDRRLAVTTLPDQRLTVRATTVDTASGRYLVESGASVLQTDAVLDHLLDLLALLLPMLIVSAAGSGYLLVNLALRPVDRLSRTAEQLSLQNLSQRLPIEPTGDALERLSISLNNMLGRLRDSVQMSRRFLADASHELRTPLTVIKGELQELSSAANPSSEELRERVGSVLEELARLEQLVSGLLMISRLDAGERPRDWVDVDVAELAHSTAEQMRLIAEDRGIEIEQSQLKRSVVRGDRARLKQVIVNLLDNAIRFTPRGGRVALRTLENEDFGILEVRDSGIGIPAAALPDVFDRFFRVDDARSREDGGAGLGLSIVKSICSAHGADIEVESEPGVGSCFRVRFPRRFVKSSVPAPANPAEPL